MRLTLLLLLSINFLAAQRPFSLDEAIEFAIEHSADMQMAELDIRDADAQITEFKAIGLPQISGSANYQYYMEIPVNPVQDFITPSVYQILVAENVPGVQPFQGEPEIFEFQIFQRNNLNLGVEGSWLLFDGSYLSGLKAAKLYRELTKKSLDVTEEEIRANVTKAYMNILIAEENKATLAKNLDNITKALNETRAYYNEGLVEQLDVSRIELSFENVKTEYEKLDQFIDISYNLLKFQMNFPAREDIVLTEDLQLLVDKMKVENADLEEEIDYANRAVYDQLNASLVLNEMNVQRLKNGYLPNLKARANYNQLMQRADLFNSDELGFIPQASVSLAVNIPIFDGNMKKGQVQQAKIEIDKINLQKSEFERAMELQVRNARLQYINARKTLENREKSLELVEDIYNKTSIKFREGVGSSIELTQAESQLYEAQANHINALYDLLISKTDLEIALGNL